MVTIKDVSKRSGFSVTTVSKALNNYPDISAHTRKTILNLCNEMGYIPNSSARSLKTHKSYTIGVVFEEVTNQGLQHPVFSRILESFKKEVENKGYDIMLLAKRMANQNGSYLQHSKRKQVEAILVLCADFNSEELIELYQSDIPVVMIDFAAEKAINITSDNASGVKMAVDYLVDLGHKKIAHIYGDQNSFIGGQRKEFFEINMAKHGLKIPDDYLHSGEFFSKEEGYQAMSAILKLKDQPTAVFCASDLLAIGAIEAVQDHGLKVPEDFSIVGFDGIDLAELITPKLTTIKQDTKRMGQFAAEKMLGMIDGVKKEKAEEIVSVDTFLVKGASVKNLT